MVSLTNPAHFSLRLGLRDQPRDTRGAFARNLRGLRDAEGRKLVVVDMREVERRLKARKVEQEEQ